MFAADAGTSVDALLTEAGGALVRHLLLYGLVPTPLSPQQLAASPVLNTSWAGQMVFVPQPFMVGAGIGIGTGGVGHWGAVAVARRCAGMWCLGCRVYRCT